MIAKSKYPRLSLIEQTAVSILQKDMTEEERGEYNPDIEITMFRQTWPNTATGFSEPGMFAGQAFTDEYTTVVYEKCVDAYIVFFGEKPAYRVDAPTDAFFTDLMHRRMKNVGAARVAY